MMNTRTNPIPILRTERSIKTPIAVGCTQIQSGVSVDEDFNSSDIRISAPSSSNN